MYYISGASILPWSRGVSGGQYTDEPLKTALIQNPIQYTSWKASSDKMRSTTSQKRRREQWLNGSTQIIGPNLCTVLELLKCTLA